MPPGCTRKRTGTRGEQLPARTRLAGRLSLIRIRLGHTGHPEPINTVLSTLCCQRNVEAATLQELLTRIVAAIDRRPRPYHRTVPGPDHDPLPLIQSFANTRSAAPGPDHLRTREEAAVWLRAAALLPAEAGLSNSEHAALLRLRESIRDVLAAHTAGREDAEAATRLTKALADGRLVVTVDPASTIQLASGARASYSSLVAAVAVAGCAVSGAWLRLKACAAPDCGQAFHDDSPASTVRHCPRHAA